MTPPPNLFNDAIDAITRQLTGALESLPSADRIAALNRVREQLHAVSPFKDEPVDLVLWVPAASVDANDYNPNTVAPPEMKLLALSILEDGYTQPIVTAPEGDRYTTIDGFHRGRVGKENPRVRERVQGYLPITRIRSHRSGRSDRQAATIRHNRARGVHGVVPMSDLVADLVRSGLDSTEIARELGMDADEVLRFKQLKGLPELFADSDYSRAWDPGDS